MEWEDTIWGFLTLLNKEFPCVPSAEKRSPVSSGQIKRMLENRAVTVNGKKPGPKDPVELPITELIFFKNSKSQCTLFGGDIPWQEWHDRHWPNCKTDKPCSQQH